MTTTDTIRGVARPRGVLTEDQLRYTTYMRMLLDSYRDEWRDWVLGLLADGRSFSEVAKATGLSKDTLQRWKREAGK